MEPIKKHLVILITNSYAALNTVHSGLITSLASFFQITIYTTLTHLEQSTHIPASCRVERLSLHQPHYVIKISRRLQVIINSWLLVSTSQISTKILQFVQKWIRKRLQNISMDTNCNRMKADLILATSPFEYTEQLWCNHYKKSKTKLIGMVISWDNLTRKGIITTDFDLMLLWNKQMHTEYNFLYDYFNIPYQQILIVGAPRMEFGTDLTVKTKEHILLCTSSIKHYQDTPFIISQVLEFLEDYPDVRLKIRCHPSDTPIIYEPFFNHKNIAITYASNEAINTSRWFPEDRYLLDLQADLQKAYCCIHIASTARIDALLSEVPTIGISYGKTCQSTQKASKLYQFYHQKTLDRYIPTDAVHTKEALFDKLKQYLSGKTEREEFKAIRTYLPYSNQNHRAQTIHEWSS